MGMIVRWRGRRERGLGAVSLSDAYRCGHGRMDELMGGRSLAEESLHPTSSTLVHNNHLDDLLALNESFWAELPGLDGAEQSGGCSQGQRCGLNAGLAQLIGLQPLMCCCCQFCRTHPVVLREIHVLCVPPLDPH